MIMELGKEIGRNLAEIDVEVEEEEFVGDTERVGVGECFMAIRGFKRRGSFAPLAVHAKFSEKRQ